MSLGKLRSKANTAPNPRRIPTWLIGHAVITYTFLYLPIAVLVLFSFSNSRYSTVWNGFTLNWYSKLFHNQELINAAINSLYVAGAATLIAAVIGTLAAYTLWLRRLRVAASFNALLLAPVVMPEIVQGIGLLIFFSLVIQMELSLLSVTIAHSVFCIAYVATVVNARLNGMSHTLFEAALNLGATPTIAFWRVLFPLLWPGILGGSLLAFTLSFDNVIVTFFVSGPGETTLPMAIYSMVKRGVTPEINALATLILAFSIMLIAVSLKLQKDQFTRTQA